MASWEFSSKNNVPKEIKELVGMKWKSFLEKGKTNCLLFVRGGKCSTQSLYKWIPCQKTGVPLISDGKSYSHSIMLFSVDLKFDIIDAEIIIEWFSIKKAFIMQSQNLSKHTKLSTLEQGSAIWSGYQSYNVIMELLSNYGDVKSIIHGRCSGLINKEQGVKDRRTYSLPGCRFWNSIFRVIKEFEGGF